MLLLAHVSCIRLLENRGQDDQSNIVTVVNSVMANTGVTNNGSRGGGTVALLDPTAASSCGDTACARPDQFNPTASFVTGQNQVTDQR